ncbi:helix-turn-helix domain-containing protein [Terrabacter sp. AAH1]
MRVRAKQPGTPGRQSSELSVAVAAQFKAERAAARLDLQELADKAGLTLQTVMRLLNHKRVIDVAQFGALCEGLGLSPEVVMSRAVARLCEDDDAVPLP